MEADMIAAVGWWDNVPKNAVEHLRLMEFLSGCKCKTACLEGPRGRTILIVEDRARGFRKIKFVPVAGKTKSLFCKSIKGPRTIRIRAQRSSCILNQITFQLEVKM